MTTMSLINQLTQALHGLAGYIGPQPRTVSVTEPADVRLELDVTSVDRDSRKAAAKLLDAAQVATVPGIVFGEHGEGHLRFSFSTTPVFPRA